MRPKGLQNEMKILSRERKRAQTKLGKRKRYANKRASPQKTQVVTRLPAWDSMHRHRLEKSEWRL